MKFSLLTGNNPFYVELDEMAKAVVRPTTLFLNYKGSKRSAEVVNGIVKDTNLFMFYEYVKANKVTFVDGKIHKILNLSDVLKQIEQAADAADFITKKPDFASAKKIMDDIILELPEGPARIHNISPDTTPFTKTDFKGAGNNKYDQGLQCIISACAENNIKPNPYNASQIAKFVDLGQVTIRECLVSYDKSWLRSAFAVQRALHQEFGSFSGYVWHEEGSTLSSQIYEAAKNVFVSSGESFPKSEDRWNPADVWAVSPSFSVSEIQSCKSVDELNLLMSKYLKEKTLIGISLKKVITKYKKGIKTAKLTHKNDPAAGKVKPYTFTGEYTTRLSSSKPVGTMALFAWASEQNDKVRMVTSTYGADVAAGQPKTSDIRFAFLTASGGAADGTIMGGTVRKIYESVGAQTWSKKELLEEFKEGMINKDPAFFAKFAALLKETAGFSISADKLKEYCLRPEYINADGTWPEKGASPGNAPGTTWFDAHYASSFNRLSADKQKELITKLHSACSSTEIGCHYVMLGS